MKIMVKQKLFKDYRPQRQRQGITSLVFPRASLCSIKYVVVKTLLEKQPITQIKRPHYPSWDRRANILRQSLLQLVLPLSSGGERILRMRRYPLLTKKCGLQLVL